MNASATRRALAPQRAHTPTARRRTLLLAWLFASTAAYAASFFLNDIMPRELRALAVVIAAGAAASWLVLGTAALAWARRAIHDAERRRAIIWGRAKRQLPSTRSPALFDVCLRTAAWGDALLSLGTLLNLAIWLAAAGSSDPATAVAAADAYAAAPAPVSLATVLLLHASVLIASATAMTFLFFRGAQRAGVPTRVAAALWFAGLNGTMLVILAAFATPLGYAAWLLKQL